jgi:hypothetical protein
MEVLQDPERFRCAARHFGAGLVRVGLDGQITHLIPVPAGRRFVGAGIERIRLSFTGVGLP